MGIGPIERQTRALRSPVPSIRRYQDLWKGGNCGYWHGGIVREEELKEGPEDRGGLRRGRRRERGRQTGTTSGAGGKASSRNESRYAELKLKRNVGRYTRQAMRRVGCLRRTRAVAAARAASAPPNTGLLVRDGETQDAGEEKRRAAGQCQTESKPDKSQYCVSRCRPRFDVIAEQFCALMLPWGSRTRFDRGDGAQPR